MRRIIFLAMLFTIAYTLQGQEKRTDMDENKKIQKTDGEWKAVLTPEQYNICRLKGTEAPGSGKYDKFYKPGYYKCVACGARLFDSNTKYDSGSFPFLIFCDLDPEALILHFCIPAFLMITGIPDVGRPIFKTTEILSFMI